jgi:hypothetical protein
MVPKKAQKNPMEAGRFHIVGGGCFGSQYLRWLLRARSLGWLRCDSIEVIDRNPQCLAAREGLVQPSVRLHPLDWIDYFTAYLVENFSDETASQDHWVPSPLSPHILFLGFLRAAGRIFPQMSFRETAFREEIPTPVKMELPVGTLAVSFAEWRCPVNCIEPPRCPHIHQVRDWDMKDTLESYFHSHPHRSAHVLQCRHFIHGVGTIPCASIFEEFKKFLENLKRGEVTEVEVATVSGCHGLIGRADRVRKGGLEPEAKGQDPHQKQAAQ